MEKYQAQVGDRVMGDEWTWHYELAGGGNLKDASFPGCQFRLKGDSHDHMNNYAVNIKTTGFPKIGFYNWKSRCKIEIVGDGEASTFVGGLLYHDNK